MKNNSHSCSLECSLCFPFGLALEDSVESVEDAFLRVFRWVHSQDDLISFHVHVCITKELHIYCVKRR